MATAPLTSYSATETLGLGRRYGYIVAPGTGSSCALEWSSTGTSWTRFANHPTSAPLEGGIPAEARFVRGLSFGTVAGTFAVFAEGEARGEVSGLVPGDVSAAALNAAILAAACAVPGRKQIPAGTFYCAAFAITASVVLEGAGASNAWSPVTASPTAAEGLAAGEQAATTLVFQTADTDFISVLAPGVVVRNLHIQGNQNATAGSLINFGSASAPADGWKLQDCSAKWGFIQVRNTNGAGYSLRGNYLLGARGNAFYVENVANADYGDPEIHGNSFVALFAAPAAVYVKGSGGLRFTNNKINWGSVAFTNFATYNWGRGIHIDNPTGNTSVLVLSGNSIENIDKQAVFVDCSTAGAFSGIVIGANEFFSCGAAVGEFTIDVRGRAAALLHNISIAANSFQATRGIHVEYIDSGAVGLNTWYSMGGTGPFLDLGPSTGGIDALPQSSGNAAAGQVYFQDNDVTSFSSQTRQRGNRIQQFTRDIPNVASNAVYTDLFQVRIADYSFCEFEVSFACSSAGNGQASMRAARMLANEAGAATLGIIGADTAICRVGGTTAVTAVPVSATNPIPTGGDIDVAFTTGVSGSLAYVNIRVKRSAGATGTALNGTVTLTVKGPVYYVQKVA